MTRLRRRWVLAAASGSALILAVTMVTGLVFAGNGWGPPSASSAGNPVAVHAVRGRKVSIPVMRSYSRPGTSWPAAQTAAVSLTGAGSPEPGRVTAGPSAGSGRAGALPVWVGPPDAPASTADEAMTAAGRVSRMRVNMASHQVAVALGVRGVVFSVARADGGAAAARAHVSVDYGSFAHAYGGDYASRLHLAVLPACALTTPAVARCRVQVPAGSADSVAASRVGADVTVPGAAAAAAIGRAGSAVLTSALTAGGAEPLVLAVTAGPAGSAGNFAAEPVSEASEWVSSRSSGAFTSSYPIQVPPVPGGLQPMVNLKYDSQVTDGLSSSTNNQASWVGEGWDYAPGFIEDEYVPCSGEQGLPGSSYPDTGDLCPDSKGRYLTLSLNGTASTMVAGKNGVYTAEADGGGKIQNLGSAAEADFAGS